MSTVHVHLHRWFDLAVVLFLLIGGMIEAAISRSHELDGWPKPDLCHELSGTQGQLALQSKASARAASNRLPTGPQLRIAG